MMVMTMLMILMLMMLLKMMTLMNNGKITCLSFFLSFSAWALWAHVLRDADSPVPGHEFYGQVDP